METNSDNFVNSTTCLKASKIQRLVPSSRNVFSIPDTLKLLGVPNDLTISQANSVRVKENEEDLILKIIQPIPIIVLSETLT